ncbi:MAG: dihydroorotate dehydrogenase [Clostridiales bacterium]|jgi:dihydroorotate dehydrogenase (NAD+) catalytic subunit|uniref:dihydroorotate dehydrogenase n=1 Tax=Chordicoccus furentiruminis TaxID=2709410 RepID=UPI0023A866EC|nr:dihydroorotate dehydrogenase [Chordicoccus furentiruminis]MCI6173647.1 dihydroorotate dehydrogenase [Clostridiales bacterium]
MADLSSTVFGKRFKNPIVMASGVFGYGREYEEFFPLSRLGGLCTKGTTLHKRAGNEGVRITECDSGLLFSVGLQNPGIDYYIRNDLPNLLTKDTNIFTNVAALETDEYEAIVRKLEETDAPLIELNISCPNTAGEPLAMSAKSTEMITARIRKLTKKPFVVKLSPNAGNVAEIAKAAESAGADGISLVNSIHGFKIDLRTRRPVFRNNLAGMSGSAIYPIALRMVWQTARAVKIPVIGIGGVDSGEKAVEMMMAGASLVQVGSAIFRDPYAPLHVIDEMNEWMDANHVSDVKELIGSVKPW